MAIHGESPEGTALMLLFVIPVQRINPTHKKKAGEIPRLLPDLSEFDSIKLQNHLCDAIGYLFPSGAVDDCPSEPTLPLFTIRIPATCGAAIDVPLMDL